MACSWFILLDIPPLLHYSYSNWNKANLHLISAIAGKSSDIRSGFRRDGQTPEVTIHHGKLAELEHTIEYAYLLTKKSVYTDKVLLFA